MYKNKFSLKLHDNELTIENYDYKIYSFILCYKNHQQKLKVFFFSPYSTRKIESRISHKKCLNQQGTTCTKLYKFFMHLSHGP